MTQVQGKKYPQGTPEVAKMLGILIDDAQNLPENFTKSPAQADDSNLGHTAKESARKTTSMEEKVLAHNHGSNHTAMEGHESESKSPVIVRVAKAFVPYVAVFGVALVIYVFFFSNINLNLNSLWKKTPAVVKNDKQTVLENYIKNHYAEYQAWISQFYFDVSDPKIIDPDTDNSGNGLSNFEKFLLNINPKSYDTLGLGMADSEALQKGINPGTGLKLTEAQNKVLEKYIDMEVVMNRFALAQIQNRNNVAGAQTWQNNSHSSQIAPRGYFNESGKSILNFETQNNRVLPANPNPPASLQTQNQTGNSKVNGQTFRSPVTGPEILDNPYELDINSEIPGLLEIPDLNIKVPVIWTKSTKDFGKDLQNGVVHYPGTAMPGEIGTSYISGHSSNYVWAKGNFNQIFATLGDLPVNTSFKITLVQKNGRDAILHYVVTKKQEFKPTDQAQFENSGESVVALSTCWPVGTTQRRLVVFGTLTQVEK